MRDLVKASLELQLSDSYATRKCFPLVFRAARAAGRGQRRLDDLPYLHNHRAASVVAEASSLLSIPLSA